MNSFLVCCDLKNQFGNYQPFFEKVTSFGTQWFQVTTHTWIIKSNLSPGDIMTILRPLIYQGDRVFIVESVRKAAWEGLDTQEEKWLSDYL